MELTKESQLYTFLEFKEEYSNLDTLPIKILVGEYKDIHFRFTKILIKQEGEELFVTFDFELLKSPNQKETYLNDNNFIDFLGNILYDIVVNRTDITTEVDKQDEPVDLEADVHEDSNGKNYS